MLDEHSIRSCVRFKSELKLSDQVPSYISLVLRFPHKTRKAKIGLE